MLGRISVTRHAVVVVAVLLVPLAVLVGWIGGGHRPERFDAKQVVVTPVGDGVRIREVVDQDFGSTDRHGYQRIVPHDFGVPTDIEASTDGAPSSLWVSDLGDETRMRIGDPDVTIDGQHRYRLAYTLPDAGLSSDRLALDIIGTDETLETGRFELILAGFDLEDPACNVGGAGASGGCELVRDGDVYRVVFEPLRPGEGITVGGTIVRQGRPPAVPLPAEIEPHPSHRVIGALVLLAIAAAGAAAMWLVQSRRGRNVIGGDGIIDAAFQDTVAPGPETEPGDALTRLVTDAELDDMATIEFEPPRGLHPWQGAILLDEAVSSRSVSAWFAEQIATDVLELHEEPARRLAKGPKWQEVDVQTEQYVRDLFGDDDSLSLGRYQPTLGSVWSRLTADQNRFVKDQGWWVDRGPGTGNTISLGASAAAVLGVPAATIAAIVLWALGWWDSWIVCAVAALVLGGGAAAIAYEPLRARRSVQGSALALRAESFRRFLASSEGQHVDWAWERGVLREYTAWAVALGAAAAWGRAIDASAVPPSEVAALMAPAVFERQLSSIESSRTPPPPPSSSGGSGGSSSFSSSFSSGSVGGGGGGGSSGSW
jgi:hypothetical protein